MDAPVNWRHDYDYVAGCHLPRHQNTGIWHWIFAFKRQRECRTRSRPNNNTESHHTAPQFICEPFGKLNLFEATIKQCQQSCWIRTTDGWCGVVALMVWRRDTWNDYEIFAQIWCVFILNKWARRQYVSTNERINPLFDSNPSKSNIIFRRMNFEPAILMLLKPFEIEYHTTFNSPIASACSSPMNAWWCLAHLAKGLNKY